MEERVLIFRAPDYLMGSCLVRVEASLQLVIVSWPQQLSNQSRCIETVASELMLAFPFNPNRLLLIEHFPQDYSLRSTGELFYLVRFTWENWEAKLPVRIPLSNLLVNQLLSCLKTSI